jgi:calcium-dependent protein kinase
MAPEVIDGFYDEKCDIWSCGVILYTMLFGKYPFKADNRDELFSVIKKGHLDFQDEAWKSKSKELKGLLSKMLTVNANERISASDALKHKWFQKMFKGGTKKELKSQETKEVLQNLKRFHVSHKQL